MMEALVCHPLGLGGSGRQILGSKMLINPRYNQGSDAAVKKEASTRSELQSTWFLSALTRL